jgi:hypothetical protein
MNKPELYNEKNTATYCPEDDKLRLYVGRVPRDEYEALRAEGWTSTPKQDCDFVAVWTPERENTALSYAGEIDDEDQDPADRAADRAERFAGYRDKRTAEAVGHADRYDAGPTAHGYQNAEKADRAAARHDRIAGRAVTQWDKAEYWTRRTAGVIANALHRSAPGVRMGRIKTLEAEQRKLEKAWREHTETEQARFDAVQSVVDHADGEREKIAPMGRQDFLWTLSKLREKDDTPEGEKSPIEQMRRAVIVAALSSGWGNPKAWEALAEEAREGTRPALEIAREWLAGRTRPEDWDPESSRSWRHLRMRLAYELQMLEAQGGRAALVEMVPGGFLGHYQIHKVNKSNATGRVVSVAVMVKTRGQDRWGNEDPNAPEYRLETINIERMKAETYRAPTAEELEAFHAAKKSEKAARPKSTAPPLINPTKEDAERLQDCINAAYLAEWTKHHGTPSEWRKPKDPGTVCEMTQGEYSARSKGAYASAETKDVCALGEIDTGHRTSSAARARKARIGPVICKIRMTGYEPARVIHITDKPAKPLPAAIWEAYTQPVTPETLRPRARELVQAVMKERDRTEEENKLILDGINAGLVNDDTWRMSMTETGHAWAREAGAYNEVTA